MKPSTHKAGDLSNLGFHRVACACPKLSLANPMENAKETLRMVKELAHDGAELVVFPELSITGYTIEDLHHDQEILDQTRNALAFLKKESDSINCAFVVGGPFQTVDGRVWNTAFVIAEGEIVGAIPKIHLPNYGEFYEKRWFVSGAGIEFDIDDSLLGKFPFTSRQLFSMGELIFGVEICEDLWAPIPP